MKVLVSLVLLAHVAFSQVHLPVPSDDGRDVHTTIPNGEVRGRRVTLEDPWYNGIEIDNYLGIPFGEDTGGENRFKWPQKKQPWTPATHDGGVPGPACIQNVGPGMIWMTHPFWFSYSEDCLNLNVHTPATPIDGPLAVMVWFHGGAYTSGFNLQYPGHFLAANDVVVVVVNYRLHTMGFLSLEHPTEEGEFHEEAPGNAGMMDQQLALEWVQENIEYFGGDPTRVTIFGQSAGASSSALHMMSPKGQHLFHRVIGQSGAESAFWAMNWPSQDPNQYARQVGENLECPDVENPTNLANCLKAANWTQIVQASNITCAEGHFCQGFAPIIDGEGGFMPDYPENIRARDEAWKGDLITGITREDGSLYTLFFIPEVGWLNDGKGITHDEFHYFLANQFMKFWEASFSEEIWEKAFNAFDWFYSNWPHIEDLEANRQAFNLMSTDAAFGMPADRQARENSHGDGTTYYYVYGMRPKHTYQVFPEWMGVPHMGELPMVWGYPLLQYNEQVRNNSRIWLDVVEYTCEEDALWTIFVQKMWTNFAKTGNPTSEPVKLPTTVAPDAEVAWPEFEDTTEERDKLNYLYLENSDIHHDDAYRQREFEFFRTYMVEILEHKFRIKRDAEEKPSKGPRKGVSADIFSGGMERQMTKLFEEKLGEERYNKLVEKAQSLKSVAEWEDLLRSADDGTPILDIIGRIGLRCPRPEK